METENGALILKNARRFDVFSGRSEKCDVALKGGRIAAVGSLSGENETDLRGALLLPGFADSHLHIESSLLTPPGFVRAALPHGTTAVFADPHEIANVCGAAGIRMMLDSSAGLPAEVYFMLPSCVPAAPQEEAGASLGAAELEPFYDEPRVRGLGELMNCRGLLSGDADLTEKVSAALRRGLRADGHAPGLSGPALRAYARAGISSDHECTRPEEALERLELGMWVMIREGTAARDLEALLPLLSGKYADRCLFCTDDCHVDGLLENGHIDAVLRRAVAAGAPFAAAVRAATINAARYFGIAGRGAVEPGYAADLCVCDDGLNVLQVYKDGRLAAEEGRCLPFDAASPVTGNTVRARRLTEGDFGGNISGRAIRMLPRSILTADGGPARLGDAKIACVERHGGSGRIGLAWLRGYGISRGAVASSVAHDAHNLIVAGADGADMAAAANRVRELGGGFAVAAGGRILAELPLPVAGLMSPETPEAVAGELALAKAAAHSLGVPEGIDPFMTLGFMSLPVIPKLRVTTRGLFDTEENRYI